MAVTEALSLAKVVFRDALSLNKVVFTDALSLAKFVFTAMCKVIYNNECMTNDNIRKIIIRFATTSLQEVTFLCVQCILCCIELRVFLGKYEFKEGK